MALWVTGQPQVESPATPTCDDAARNALICGYTSDSHSHVECLLTYGSDSPLVCWSCIGRLALGEVCCAAASCAVQVDGFVERIDVGTQRH
ncbi:hypothetical protein NJBCHELONAE_48610 [Mycobacteroides chelonae]|nr:hypothetical protein NJBCHELONAE_48610 [Mycobacteroides chelonae]